MKYRLFYSALAFLIGGPLVCLCLFLLFRYILPWLDTIHIEETASPALITVAIAAGSFILLMGFALGLAWFTIRRRKAALDAVFTPLGLTGNPYMLQFRQYHGRIGGREVDIYFFRGPTLEIHVAGEISAGVQVCGRESLQAAAAGLFDKTPVDASSTGLSDYSIYAADREWSGAFLKSYGVSDAVQALMEDGAGWALFRWLELISGEIVLHLYRSKSISGYPLEMETVNRWLAGMRVLVEAAESLPEPQIKAQRKALGAAARQKISKFTALAVIASLLGIPACTVIAGVIVYLSIVSP